MKKIGFVGLGHMGAPMALNLVKAGYQVTVYDIVPQAMLALVQAGAIGAQSVKALAEGQDVLITMLQTGEQVSNVCQGEAGLFEHAKPGALFIDCSSIDVSTSRQLHQLALRSGLHPLDAPVSGGVAGAQMASLTIMVGGNEDDYLLALPLLQSMGKTLIHAGIAGTGQAAKICNNMILGISMAAISEAFTLGEKLGLSAEKLFNISSSASGQCWAMTSYCPVPNILDSVPSSNDYKPGFTAAMMLKDLNLSQMAAQDVDLDTAMGRQAQALYEKFVEQNHASTDFSGIIKMIAGE